MTDPVTLLSQFHGEGLVTFRALREAGYTSLGRVADASPRELAYRTGLSLQTARRLRAGARTMMAESPAARTGRPEVAAPLRSPPTGSPAFTAAPPPSVFSPGLSPPEASLLVESNGHRDRPGGRVASDTARRSDAKPSAPPGPTFWSFG